MANRVHHLLYLIRLVVVHAYKNQFFDSIHARARHFLELRCVLRVDARGNVLARIAELIRGTRFTPVTESLDCSFALATCHGIAGARGLRRWVDLHDVHRKDNLEIRIAFYITHQHNLVLALYDLVTIFDRAN